MPSEAVTEQRDPWANCGPLRPMPSRDERRLEIARGCLADFYPKTGDPVGKIFGVALSLFDKNDLIAACYFLAKTNPSLYPHWMAVRPEDMP